MTEGERLSHVTGAYQHRHHYHHRRRHDNNRRTPRCKWDTSSGRGSQVPEVIFQKKEQLYAKNVVNLVL